MTWNRVSPGMINKCKIWSRVYKVGSVEARWTSKECEVGDEQVMNQKRWFHALLRARIQALCQSSPHALVLSLISFHQFFFFHLHQSVCSTCWQSSTCCAKLSIKSWYLHGPCSTILHGKTWPASSRWPLTRGFTRERGWWWLGRRPPGHLRSPCRWAYRGPPSSTWPRSCGSAWPPCTAACSAPPRAFDQY